MITKGVTFWMGHGFTMRLIILSIDLKIVLSLMKPSDAKRMGDLTKTIWSGDGNPLNVIYQGAYLCVCVHIKVLHISITSFVD